MSGVSIRPYTAADTALIERMIRAVWQIGRFSDNGRLLRRLVRMNRCRTLMHTDYVRVAEVDGVACGVLAARFDGAGLGAKIRYAVPYLWHRIWLAMAAGSARRVVKAYYGVEKSYKRLYRRTGGRFDSELVLFAVDASSRGSGVGGSLMHEYAEECRRRGARMYLFTDTMCDVSYYDHNGFERLAEEQLEVGLAGGKVDYTTYIYSKRF